MTTARFRRGSAGGCRTPTGTIRGDKQFHAGNFEIIRKPPSVLLAMMRSVYNNDEQADDLKGKEGQAGSRRAMPGTTSATPRPFATEPLGASEQPDWIHYRHRLRNFPGQDSLITDFMGYNSGECWSGILILCTRHGSLPASPLMPTASTGLAISILECEVKVEKGEGELILQLVRGQEKFQATWDLSSDNGLCTLARVKGKKTEKLESKPTRLRKSGTYRLRFANVDDRLTVWVDGDLPFGDGVAYAVAHPEKVIPTAADLRPASIGVRSGSLSVQKIKLYRDTYHTVKASEGDVPDFARSVNPEDWKGKEMPLLTMYVQPGHYLCLGDNSLASADSRSWGLVPERLMLGKALLVYWPLKRAGRIR